MLDRYRQSVYVQRSEGLYRWIQRLVQTGYRHLSDGIFADDHTLCRTSDLYSARSACGRDMPCGK